MKNKVAHKQSDFMELFLGGEDYNQQAATGEILGTPQIVFDELKAKDGVSVCTITTVRELLLSVSVESDQYRYQHNHQEQQFLKLYLVCTG